MGIKTALKTSPNTPPTRAILVILNTIYIRNHYCIPFLCYTPKSGPVDDRAHNSQRSMHPRTVVRYYLGGYCFQLNALAPAARALQRPFRIIGDKANFYVYFQDYLDQDIVEILQGEDQYFLLITQSEADNRHYPFADTQKDRRVLNSVGARCEGWFTVANLNVIR
jgi:hypothetical protein